ncbi:MAG: hypothetical protein LAT62_02580 [Natronospirillum sp.]|uniref:hypothetical protein n=1 Tax=Natronospirillum sp. TaxID=2812955 RepID=UPI0025DEC9DE|nr:hypothetical protein [Natronospirillum sp.]MCH8550794.1 hypothetical protein [Natronospirillum sp.]
MMQRIDLRQSRNDERRLRAGTLILLLIAAVLAAGLVSALQFHLYQQRQLALTAATEDAQAAQRELEAFAVSNPDLRNTEALEASIDTLRDNLAQRRQLLTNLQRSTGARPYSYDAFLRTLAEQRLDGVWLTAFSIDNRAELSQVRVRLRGETESPDLLPQYLDRLRDGGGTRLHFDDLRLQQLDGDAGFYGFSLETRGMSEGTAGRRQP